MVQKYETQISKIEMHKLLETQILVGQFTRIVFVQSSVQSGVKSVDVESFLPASFVPVCLFVNYGWFVSERMSSFHVVVGDCWVVYFVLSQVPHVFFMSS